MSFTLRDELSVDAARARVYEHGWQSWSPTTVYPVSEESARPDSAWQQQMRFRPGKPPPDSGFQAEGLLAVDPGDGGPVRVYAAADPSTDVTSVRARLEGDRLLVSADGPIRTTDAPGGLGSALAGYGDEAGAHAAARVEPAPTVWCSWYHYFLDVTEADVVENLQGLQRLQLPVDVVQIDDGWQAAVGDWFELSGRFASIEDIASRIRDGGRRAGIWVAPFIVTEHSALAREHPEWLLGDAGWNWEQRLFGLDLGRPDVQHHVWSVFRRLREAGYDYFKLDFLYAGALDGSRDGGQSPVQAYRRGLEVVREAVGDDAYILGCGAPILPSIGLVDGMRVSPDTYHPEDDGEVTSSLRGRMCVEARAWQHGRFWVNDADCLVARPSFTARAEWAALLERYSGLRSFSDRVDDLDEWGLDTVRRLLTSVPPPTPFPTLPDAYER